MNQSTNTPVTPFDWLIDRIRIVIREELAIANNTVTGGITDKDALLTVDEAAALMNVNRRWIYRHAPKWTFTRRIGRKNLRFSEAGIRLFLATKKPSSSR